MKDLLDVNWPNVKEIPKPTFIVKNDADDPWSRINYRDGDYLVISSDSSEQIKYRGNIHYYDKAYTLNLEFRSMRDRQRIRDIWKVIKAICFDNKWDFTGYQLLRMTSYQESTNSEFNVWRGVIKVIVESGAVPVETLA